MFDLFHSRKEHFHILLGIQFGHEATIITLTTSSSCSKKTADSACVFGHSLNDRNPQFRSLSTEVSTHEAQPAYGNIEFGDAQIIMFSRSSA